MTTLAGERSRRADPGEPRALVLQVDAQCSGQQREPPARDEQPAVVLVDRSPGRTADPSTTTLIAMAMPLPNGVEAQ
ncbi:hypothetical protein [Pseudonocardia aurantiaca]|uniref:Uncharacterized protein n=1 Tax=Pseudonocardia aurantiaca TaxID=75290 RepID=A0ABW4FHI2_9PSEU